jgi:hypothetical protein
MRSIVEVNQGNHKKAHKLVYKGEVVDWSISKTTGKPWVQVKIIGAEPHVPNKWILAEKCFLTWSE